jgi:signal transduction histidine kinase
VLFQGTKNQAEMFAKYQLEKKEREIAENKAQIAEANFESLMLTSVSVALVLLFIVAFLYFRSKRKQARAELAQTRKEEKLLREKQLYEQKLEISRELHDNIGSQITYMISSMDNLTYTNSENEPMNHSIRNISEFGRETMKDLRSTIWAMNTEDGSLNALVHKLEELRSKVQLPIDIQNNIAGNPELKATEMLNLYRIIQEAIQNSLKYAEASVIRILIDETDEGLKFEIADDGKGFDSALNSSGNGIMNMKHRSSKMNANLKISSETGKGTSVVCILDRANVVLNMPGE